MDIKINQSLQFVSEKPLYFSPINKGASITIDETVNSSIGIIVDNSPTIRLSSNQNMLYIMANNTRTPSIKIELIDSEEAKIDPSFISFREVNSRIGYLNFDVPEKIKTFSLKTLLMSRDSSIRITRSHSSSSSSKLLSENDDDENGVEIQVDEMKINSRSKSIIHQKVNLNGNLTIYDDSYLRLDKKAVFSKESKIDLVFLSGKSSQKEAIIWMDEPFNSIPLKSIVSFEPKVKSFDISDFPVLSAPNFSMCQTWCGTFQMDGQFEGQINANCIVDEDDTENDRQILTVSVKSKKKLSTAAIVGIVIGCVAVVAIIVAIVLILIKKKKNAYMFADDISDLEEGSTF